MKPGNPYGKDTFKYGSDDWAARRALEESRKPKPAPAPVFVPPPPIPYHPPHTGRRDPINQGTPAPQLQQPSPGVRVKERSPGITDNIPSAPKSLILTLVVIGCVIGTGVAANAHASALVGALTGAFLGAIAIPLLVIAFRLLKIAIAIGAIIVVLYLIVHSLSH